MLLWSEIKFYLQLCLLVFLFSYDTMWYHVFNENFYLELSLNCEIEYLEYLNILKSKHLELAFKN